MSEDFEVKYDPNQGQGRLKSVNELCSQDPVLMDFEGYVLRPYDEYNLWFENPRGEGTTIMRARVKDVLENLFKETF